MAVIVSLSLSCRRTESTATAHGINSSLAAILNPADTVNRYALTPGGAPDDNCVRLRIHGIGGTLGRVFNDSNARHLEYASANGARPIHDMKSLWEQSKNMEEVVSGNTLYIDSLTHSYPYLRPHAKALLEEIGQRFADSLAARGGGAYRLKVTSILRTEMTVGKLRRVNRNASPESAHSYGTTFDISYSKFICDDPSKPHRTFEDLKNLLAEVVFALRAEGRCVVKHERRQACFHITAAPPKK